MQDRYLFCGKRKTNGELVEGTYYEEPYTNRCYIIRWNRSGFGTNEFAEVDTSTICQCTGLKDKNGKLIWENDIVFVTDEDGCTGGYDTGMGQIMFLKGLWYIDGTVQNGLYDTFDEGFNIEVIGNKFDNPELLEVQE